MADALVIKIVSPRDTLNLRHTLLRPHLTPDNCVYPGDETDTTTHLGAFVEDELVGIVSLYRENQPDEPARIGYRFRALAVIEGMRGKKIGQALLDAVEKLAMESGTNYIWANARTTAIDFYRKSGYAVDDEEFMVAGVGPHRIVRKRFPEISC